MKVIKIILTIVINVLMTVIITAQNEYPSYLNGYENIWKSKGPKTAAIEWFRNARFGMFVHFSPANQLNDPVTDFIKMNEYWFKRHNDIVLDNYSYKEYQDEVFDDQILPEDEELYKSFDPQKFNADKIADLAVKAGMKYINFTTSHSIGRLFMFDTSVSKWNSKRLYNRDFVAEMAVACQKRGLGLFLYVWPPSDIVQEKLMQVIKELLSNYGPIAGIWFDGIGRAYQHPTNFMESTKQYALVTDLQPQCLVSFKTGWVGDEDFLAPEWNQINFNERGNPKFPEPATFTKVGDKKVRMLRKSQTGFEWRTQTFSDVWQKELQHKPIELSTTMIKGDMWFNVENARHKTKEEVLEDFKYARKNKSNMILNISPRKDGSIHPDDLKVLQEIGPEIRIIW